MPILHKPKKRVETRSSTGATGTFEKFSKNQNRKFSKNSGKNSEILCELRSKDFDALLKKRNYDMRGYRERFLFLYRLSLKGTGKYSQEEILDILYKINQSFIEPLDQREIESATRSVDKKKYTFRNTTIIEWLKISQEEEFSLISIRRYQKSLGEKKEDKNAKRRKTGLTRREWEESTRRKNRPWEKLGISRSSWERYAARDRAINEKARRVLSCASGNLMALWIGITGRFIFLYLALRLRSSEPSSLNFYADSLFPLELGFSLSIPP